MGLGKMTAPHMGSGRMNRRVMLKKSNKDKPKERAKSVQPLSNVSLLKPAITKRMEGLPTFTPRENFNETTFRGDNNYRPIPSRRVAFESPSRPIERGYGRNSKPQSTVNEIIHRFM